MSLAKPWRSLDRSIVRGAPDRYALYEIGDREGTSLGFGIGPLGDELRDLFAYGEGSTFYPTSNAADAGDPAQVRWTIANSKPHAEKLLAEHRSD